MVEGCDIAAGHRCDDRSSQDPKIPVFVPPRPRNRRRQGKGDSRAGYWCRRTTYLAKKVTVASHEAREAKRLVQVVQVAREAHERQLQQLHGQVQALQELFAGVASAKGDGLMATHTHTHPTPTLLRGPDLAPPGEAQRVQAPPLTWSVEGPLGESELGLTLLIAPWMAAG